MRPDLRLLRSAWLRVLLALLAGLAAMLIALPKPSPPVPRPRWEPLATLTPVQGISAWPAIGDSWVPLQDASVVSAWLTPPGGEPVEGFGLYPPGEIAFDLDGAYSRFRASVGLTADAEPGRGAARFRVLVDGDERFRSPVIQAGQPPVPVEVDLRGARRLLLVVEAVPGTAGQDFAAWFRPELRTARRPVMAPHPAPEAAPLVGTLDAEAAGALEELETVPGATVLEARGAALLATHQLVAIVETAPGRVGRASFYAPADGRLLAGNLRLALEAPNGQVRSLNAAAATTARLGPVDDPLLGDGVAGQLALEVDGQPFDLEVGLYPGGAWSIETRSPPGAPSPERLVLETDLPFAGRPRFATDDGRLYEGRVEPDDVERLVRVGAERPLLLRAGDGAGALALATLGGADEPAVATLRQGAGAPLGLRLEYRSDQRLVGWLESGDGTAALDGYRGLLDRLHPPKPRSPHVTHQWLSWYQTRMDVTAAEVVRQGEALAASFGDLGRWSVLIDAGWYVADGRPDADFQNVDRTRFPAGLRPVVDHLHRLGLSVKGYLSLPYVDTVQRSGNWMGMRGFIAAHPDWLVPIGPVPGGEAFLIDFSNAGFRHYLDGVLDLLFRESGLDGLKLDGLADAHRAITYARLLQDYRGPGLDRLAVLETVARGALERRPDAYLESGAVPAAGRSWVDVLAYGDSRPVWDSPYPNGGLRDHVRYALWQWWATGERPKLGHVWGEPAYSGRLGLAWAEGALAAGAELDLSFDLTLLTPERLAEYRARLRPAQPLTRMPWIQETDDAFAFASRGEGNVYLAAISRRPVPSRVQIDLAALGFPANAPVALLRPVDGETRIVQGTLDLEIGAEDLAFVVLRTEPGLLWTSSRAEQDGASVRLSGPALAAGWAWFYAPQGIETTRAEAQTPAPGFVRLSYQHPGPVEVRLLGD